MSCVMLASLMRAEVGAIEGPAEDARDLRETPDPDERTVREPMSVNVCRCAGYTQIVDADLTTARTRAARRASDAVAVGGGEP